MDEGQRALKEMRRERLEGLLDRPGGHLFERMNWLAELNKLERELATPSQEERDAE